MEEKQVLDTKLSRGSEAIKKVSKEQEKLECKLQKLASDRDAAVAENKEATAKIKSLEVCQPACMESCGLNSLILTSPKSQKHGLISQPLGKCPVLHQHREGVSKQE